MSAGIRIKSLLAEMLGYTGQIEKRISGKSTSHFLILMYHRIIPFLEAESGLQAGMYVDPETFKMQVRYLRERFHVIPLPELEVHRQHLKSHSKQRPTCVLTFDDGWSDFYRYAYPILKEHNMPATVFLPTKYIGTNDRFWSDRIVELFIRKCTKGTEKRDYGSVSRMQNELVKSIESLTGDVDGKIEKTISLLKNHREDEIFRVLDEITKKWGGVADSKERVFLTWEEVKMMFDSGLINFGSHTNHHKILVHLDEEMIEEELSRSRDKLLEENVANPSFLSFCYPNGNYNEKVMRKVKEAGYHIAVTTDTGWNHTGTNQYILHRTAIHQDISSNRSMFGCRIAGIF